MNASAETTVRLSSSLRSRGVEESLVLAKKVAFERGVSRVVDTTWMDRIGVPVFAAIRPDGLKGSICVHAGKGFTASEAKIGAYMEAIEFSFAVPGRSAVQWHDSSPREIINSWNGALRFNSFCPLIDKSVQIDERMPAVHATEILAGLGEVKVPAELVFHPLAALRADTKRVYGTTTTGLASGNTTQEAMVHALCELMERDSRAFDILRDDSKWVRPETTPHKVQVMMEKVRAAGLSVHLRWTQTAFGLSCFSAFVLEHEAQKSSAISITGGFGCHPIAEIGAVRAVAEAIQSRLSFIHGGRDDLIKRYNLGAQVGHEEELRWTNEMRAQVSNTQGSMDFRGLPDFSARIQSIDDAQAVLFEGLRSAGLNHMTQTVFTPSEYPFQVVRLVVPGMEMYEPELPRVGPRLMQHMKQIKGQIA